MANDISTNPWILDTVTADLLWPSNVYVDHFEFVNYAVAGDQAVITNRAGQNVWVGEGDNDLQPIVSGRIGCVFNGLRVSQLDSGQVRVYLGKAA